MEQKPTVIDWKDLLLIVLLCFILFSIFWLALEWAARRWSLDWLHERGRRADIATLIAALCGSSLGIRIASALGFKPVKRRSKLDSEPPLP
ncbi:hypothetical protein V6R86_04285 [Sphingomonas kaistensis]|uniref:Uncharacterized protein n=1 Tax=Sphingomonas kaistensis TaxID=298708 RepID=A0ABZ2G051_9SPHN